MSTANDALTGQEIKWREPIVALVIDRRTGGYPDATTHAAIPGLDPTSLFEPVSLPLRGTYDEFGNIVPDEGQPALAHLLSLANQPDWNAFFEKGFGVQGSILLGDGAHGRVHPAFGKDDSHRERTLGLAIYRKATWDLVLSLSPLKEREADVDALMARFAEIRATRDAGDRDGAWRNAQLLSLEQSAFHGKPGEREELPRLARALARREGGSLVSDIARKALTGKGGPLGYDLLDREAGPETRAVVDAIWELASAELAFGRLGHAYRPSPLAAPSNQPEILTLAGSMAEQAVASLIEQSEDFPESPRLAQAERILEATARRAAELLAEVRAFRATAEPDQEPWEDVGPAP
jgi:hypothetical protein